MIKPFVSVVMITYGHEKFIKQAIEGILMQECTFDVELIIANDCSPDLTDAVVNDIILNHPKASWINYTKHEQNIGMMANFIWAMQQGTGNYIALCEGDDYWTDPYKLQKQVDFLEANPEFVMSFHNAIVIDEYGKLLKDSKIQLDKFKDYYSDELVKGLFTPPTLTLMFRNLSFVVNDMMIHFPNIINGDTLICCLLGNYGSAKYQEEIQPSAYRVHLGGVWSLQKREKQLFAKINLYHSLSEYNKKNDVLYKHFKQMKSNVTRMIIHLYLKKLRFDKFTIFFFQKL